MTDASNVSDLLAVIDRLEALLEASDLTELEVEAGGTTLILRKPEAIAPVFAAAPVQAAGGAAAAAPRADGAPAGAAADDGPAHGFHAVVAPLTGVFYISPSPGAAPYVRVGAPVSVGQVIGLIEAMKLFNEIKSDISGTVRRIAAETGALVKAKQVLVEVEPS